VTEQAAALAVRGQSLARRPACWGCRKTPAAASLVTARALIGGRLARWHRGRRPARATWPRRPLDTRPAVAADPGRAGAAGGRTYEASPASAGRGWPHCTGTALSSAAWTCRTGAAVLGQDLARAGLAAALARRAPDAVAPWSERARGPGPAAADGAAAG
jgi:hypothetical protein